MARDVAEIFDSLNRPYPRPPGLSAAAVAELAEAISAMQDPTHPRREVRRIHNRLVWLLRDTDPFWPRWLAYCESRGVDC